MLAAPCSLRVGTRRTPPSRASASKMGMLCTLMMPKAVSMPAALRQSRTISPPVRCTASSLAGADQELAHRGIERLGLLLVGDVAGSFEHDEPGARDRSGQLARRLERHNRVVRAVDDQ